MSWYSELTIATQKLVSVLDPYLSPQKKRERTTILVACIVAHLVEAALNTYFIEEAEAASEDETAWNTYVPTFGVIVFNALMYAFTVSVTNYMNHSMTASLVEANALDGWLEDNASIGIDFLQGMEQGRHLALSADTPVERVLAEHIKGVSEGTAKLFVENSNRAVSTVVALYVITSLTNINTALFYLLVGGGLVGVYAHLDKKRIDMTMEISNKDDAINARLTHIRERAAQILALNGEAHEIARIRTLLESRQVLAKKSFWQEARNNTAMYATFFGISPLLTLFADVAPAILQVPAAGTVALALYQQNVFQLMINIFISLENMTQKYPKFGASLDKVRVLQQLLVLWREFQTKKELRQVFPDELQCASALHLQHFNVSMPTRQDDHANRSLLTDVNLVLPQGVYRLVGASNAGKSTTFKALMGLWPYASGQITYPCLRRQIRFIPQETFIPYDATLLEMLMYPESSVEKFQRDEIIELLNTLNLPHLIPTLDKKRDLKMLSRGEQQRLAIIGAILARPLLLLMDEATASIDANNKRKAEALIQERLPQATLIVIDHSPLGMQPGLHDHVDVVVPPEEAHLVYAVEESGDESTAFKLQDSNDHYVIDIEPSTVVRYAAPVSPVAMTHTVMFRSVQNIQIDAQQKKLVLASELPEAKHTP